MSWAHHFDDFGPQAVWQGVGGRGGGQSRPAGGAYGGVAAPATDCVATNIADLFPGAPVPRIVGIIISMTDPRHFFNKKDPSAERYVLSLTIRDSPVDFINASCWGGQQFITDLATKLAIGQLVEVLQAMVQTKPMDGSDDKFRPWTPSAYQLSVNETKGSIAPCAEAQPWDAMTFSPLAQVPVKPHNDFYSIADVRSHGQALSGEIVSMLMVVKHVGTAKELKSKNGKQLTRCELKMFDQTSPDFVLVLWDKALIKFASEWTQKETVVFAADVRLSYDNYKKSMVATALAKTILTANPDTREARYLYQYGQTVTFTHDEYADVSANDDNIDPAQIQTVYSVADLNALLAAARSMVTSSSDLARASDVSAEPVYGVTYAFITTLNIDDSRAYYASASCPGCGQRGASLVCVNEQCARAVEARPMELTFDTRVTLTDHTGSLHGCLLGGRVAELMLGCTVNEFSELVDRDKTELKWRFLLEKCKVCFKMQLPTMERPQTTTRILSCCLVDVAEVVKHL